MAYIKIGSIENFSHVYMGVDGLFNANLIDFSVEMANGTIIGPIMNRRQQFPNLRLILDLKIALIKGNPNHPVKPKLEPGFALDTWSQIDWDWFVKDFLWYARKWSNKFFLVLKDQAINSGPYKSVEKNLSLYEDVPGDYTAVCPRVIDCVLNPIIVDVANAHHTMNVWYITDDKGKRLPKWYDYAPMRSDAQNICNTDTYTYNTIPHEIGHLLGMPHYGQLTNNPECTAVPACHSPENGINYDLNHSPCYEDHFRKSSDIMGSGKEWGTKDAYPWLIALQHITGIPSSSYRVEKMKVKADIFKPRLLNYGNEEWRDFHFSQDLTGKTGLVVN